MCVCVPLVYCPADSLTMYNIVNMLNRQEEHKLSVCVCVPLVHCPADSLTMYNIVNMLNRQEEHTHIH